MNNSPPKRKKYGISIFVLIVLMSVTFYIFFKEFSLPELIRVIKDSVHKFYILIAALMPFVYLCLYGFFTGISIRGHGRKVSPFKCFQYGCIDFFYSAITPSSSGGQPLVIYYMTRDGMPSSISVVTVIMHTVFYKVALIFYGVVSLFLVRDILFGSKTIIIVLFFTGVFITAAIIIICLLSMYKTGALKKTGNGAIRFLSKLRIIKKPEKKIEKFEKLIIEYKAAAEDMHGKKLLMTQLLTVTVIQRTVMFAVPYFIYRSFGLNEFGFLHIVCLQACISFAVDGIPIPGGMGVNEIAALLLYNSIYGNNLNIAAAAIFLSRSINYFLCLAISGFGVLSINFTAKSKSMNRIK